MIACAAVSALTSLAAPAWAQSAGADQDREKGAEKASGSGSSAKLRERVVLLLSGYHFTPDREDLNELAPEAKVASTLREIASDDSVRPSMRSRAVDLLALYPSEATTSFLRDLLEQPGADLSDEARRTANLLRHHAITSIAKMKDGAEAVSMLEDLLDADERPIRLTVISALGKYAGKPGRERLERLARRADDTLVRQELDRFVETSTSQRE